jgi:hypothetical protein
MYAVLCPVCDIILTTEVLTFFQQLTRLGGVQLSSGAAKMPSTPSSVKGEGLELHALRSCNGGWYDLLPELWCTAGG